MPAFSHCFLKRFMAFSNDSPSLTRTPGILRITTFRPRGTWHGAGRTRAKMRQYMRARVAVKLTCASNLAHLQQAVPPNSVVWGPGMSEARLSVALPEYETELAANQRTALRAAALLAVPILLAFSLLDRALAPGFWLPLLCVRLVASGVLVAIAHASQRAKATLPLVALAVAVVCGTIAAGELATGGTRSPYLISNIAVLAGLGILMPLPPRQSAILQAIGICIAVVPLLFGLRAADALPLFTSVSFLVAVAIVAIAGAHLQDGLRRREHRARIEVARQIGLINLGTLAGGLAHELSTPLTWVAVELESLELDPLAAPVREKVLAARAGASRMREVLVAMRQGARFAGGEMCDVMLPHEVDLALKLVT